MSGGRKKRTLDPSGSVQLRVGSPRWLLPALVGIVVVHAGLRFHALGVPLDRDEGAFGTIGQLILDGRVPYRDGVDQKPPGVFFIYALALLVARAHRNRDSSFPAALQRADQPARGECAAPGSMGIQQLSPRLSNIPSSLGCVYTVVVSGLMSRANSY